MLNSIRSLSLSGDSWPNYVRLEWEADDEEIRSPPTAHFIATFDDLTNTLDFDSEHVDGIHSDAGEEQEPPPTGRWTTTSSYDIYMVDTPKGRDNEEQRDTAKDNSPEKQPKQRRKRRPKSRLDNNSTHNDPAIEKGKPMGDEHATKQPSEQDEPDDQLILGENNSPDDLTPDTPPERKNLQKKACRHRKKFEEGKTEAQNSGRHTQNEVEQSTQDRGQIWQWPPNKELPEAQDAARI